MKEFNKTQELRKIKFKQNKNTYIKKVSIILSCVILVIGVLYFTFAKFESSSSSYTLINGKVGTWPKNSCNYNIGQTWDFDYTGDVQEFSVPCNGEYKIELWGAQGGEGQGNLRAGYGGYISGSINLELEKKLYVYVGQKGTKTYNVLSYNGGGKTTNGKWYGTGGGATDIRYFAKNTEITNSLLQWNSSVGLNSRIAVAGGGGSTDDIASSSGQGIAGDAGGLYGLYYTYGGKNASPSSQVSGGSISDQNCPGSFGYGNVAINTNTNGGGGGYYGGGGTDYGSMGGSSFISGHTGCVAITSSSSQSPRTGTNGATCSTGTSDNLCSVHYSGLKFTNTKMIDGLGYSWTNIKGQQEVMPNPSGGYYASGTGHKGNGYARITLLSTTDRIVKSSTEFKIGDFVEFTPTLTSYTPTTDSSSPYYTGTSNPGTINPSELTKWVVIKDKEHDGVVEMVSYNVSSDNIKFYGAGGHYNSIGALNEIARQYTNESFIDTSKIRHIGYLPGSSAESGYSPDSYYTSDINLLNAASTINGYSLLIGKTVDNNAKSYYLASRNRTNANPRSYYYYLRGVNENGSVFSQNMGAGGGVLWSSLDGTKDGDFNISYSIRPIVTLKDDVYASPSGDGSLDNPWVLIE